MTNDDSMRRVNRITTVFGFDKQINSTKSPKNTMLFIPAVNITDLEKHENLVPCIDGVGFFKTKPYNKHTQGGDSWNVDKPKKNGEDFNMD